MKLIAKILLCGDGSVGKTAIRERYLGKGFQSNYMMTIGADFAVKEIAGTVPDNGEPYTIKCSIWDLSGQLNFKDVRSIYYKGSHAMIMVYDCTNRVSFNNLTNWVEEIRKHTNIANMVMVLIANKKDLREEGKNHVTEVEGQALASEWATNIFNNKWEVPFIETSAKTGENVNESFDKLGQIFVSFKRKQEGH
jgi:Ras-related protein Rab-1A